MRGEIGSRNTYIASGYKAKRLRKTVWRRWCGVARRRNVDTQAATRPAAAETASARPPRVKVLMGLVLQLSIYVGVDRSAKWIKLRVCYIKQLIVESKGQTTTVVQLENSEGANSATN